MGGDPLSPILVVPGRSLEERQLQKKAVLWEPWGNTHTLTLHLADKERGKE